MSAARLSLDVPTVLRRALETPWTVPGIFRFLDDPVAYVLDFVTRVRSGELSWR